MLKGLAAIGARIVILATLSPGVATAQTPGPTPIAPPTAEELARVEREVAARESAARPRRPPVRGFVELGVGFLEPTGHVSVVFGTTALSGPDHNPTGYAAAGVRWRLSSAFELQGRLLAEWRGEYSVSPSGCTLPAYEYNTIGDAGGVVAALEVGVRLRPSESAPIYFGLNARGGVMFVSWDLINARCIDRTSANLPLLGGTAEVGVQFGPRDQFDVGLRISRSGLIDFDRGFWGFQVFAGWAFP